MLAIIDAIPSPITKLAVTLIYSTGLDLEEAINLKITDIDFENSTLRVPLKKNKGDRYAVLANYVKPGLYAHIRNRNLKKFIFESSNGKNISTSTIQKAVRNGVKLNNLNKDISVKSLKYSYVKHLETLGVDLLSILNELGLSPRSSYEYYATLGQTPSKVTISPIDRRVSEPLAKDALAKVEYVAEKRISEIMSLESQKYDLTKLIALLREINIAYRNQMYLSIAMLARSVIDHVPPIFGYTKFNEVENNYNGTTSFKKSMQHLNKSLRNIADSHLHTTIRRSEVLPNFIQVDFRSDIDVLLSEVVRVIKT